jgi:hypothetical protein
MSERTNLRSDTECACAFCQLYKSYAGPQARVSRRSDGRVADVYFDLSGRLTDVFETPTSPVNNPTFTDYKEVDVHRTAWESTRYYAALSQGWKAHHLL